MIDFIRCNYPLFIVFTAAVYVGVLAVVITDRLYCNVMTFINHRKNERKERKEKSRQSVVESSDDDWRETSIVESNEDDSSNSLIVDNDLKEVEEIQSVENEAPLFGPETSSEPELMDLLPFIPGEKDFDLDPVTRMELEMAGSEINDLKEKFIHRVKIVDKSPVFVPRHLRDELSRMGLKGDEFNVAASHIVTNLIEWFIDRSRPVVHPRFKF